MILSISMGQSHKLAIFDFLFAILSSLSFHQLVHLNPMIRENSGAEVNAEEKKWFVLFLSYCSYIFLSNTPKLHKNHRSLFTSQMVKIL